MTKTKNLTWDDLAKFYKKKTGNTALIRPMNTIFDWATKQKEIVENKDGSLAFVINLKV